MVEADWLVDEMADRLVWIDVDGDGEVPEFNEDDNRDFRVLDVSISGASVETAHRPPVGSLIQVGKLRARVVRHHDVGIGVEFLDIQRPDALRKYFG